jgi:acetolactate synthase-1/2/3 large subunit
MEDRFTPQRLVHDIREVMPYDGILALDNGMNKIWFARKYLTQMANTLLLDSARASMRAAEAAYFLAIVGNPKLK